MLDLSQIATLVLVLAAAIISGRLLAPYVVKVFTRAPGRLDRFLTPIENTIYRLLGVDPNRPMGWREYFLAALIVNILQMALAFVVFVSQDFHPLNPRFPGLTWDLAFMQVISFATTTNLQHYNGEVTLSYLSQMTAVQFLQFSGAATGLCVAIAMIRCFKVGATNLGNFYGDFVRALTRLLFPLCLVSSLIFVGLGVPQTLGGNQIVQTIEGATQTIFVGPVASLVSIMQIGTNGGGYYGANSAHPLQNPNPASNIFQILLMLLMPTTLCFVYGQLIGKKRETYPVLIGSFALFAINLFIAFVPTPALGQGMEVRFGGFMSAFWTVVTTAVTTGSLNASLYAMHPLVIVSAFMGMLIQATPGGKGVGVMYMAMYIVLTVFIVGLMSGRTPEYLGMKITARDIKLVMLAFLVHPVIILIPTVLAYSTGAASAIGVEGDSLGFTAVFYEFTTAAANNGSDFFGATANTPFFNISTAIVIFLGRFVPIGLLLALAGSMIGRKRSPETGLRTDSLVFTLVLVGSVLVLVVLTFFPFLVLGPVLEYFEGRVNGF